MVNRKPKLIKGQSEKTLEKKYTTPTSFTPRLLLKSIDITSSDKNHDGASRFFADLRKVCRNTK